MSAAIRTLVVLGSFIPIRYTCLVNRANQPLRHARNRGFAGGRGQCRQPCDATGCERSASQARFGRNRAYTPPKDATILNGPSWQVPGQIRLLVTHDESRSRVINPIPGGQLSTMVVVAAAEDSRVDACWRGR